ncbi:DUF2169 family type VI secretion system accessory protein [Sorangium sp. KYC3313]|uniref:DUF2169 family type VI secretion system accessory protein n=1 Tax=Sorangium sp. KYC3313 TaxID=3449740 RepID=UPI003F897D71
MLEVVNETEGRHFAVPIKDKAGREHLVVLLKLVFAVSPAGKIEPVDDDTAEPRLVDEWADAGGAGGAGSILRPSDLFDFKPGTDVVFVGHAHPPRGGDSVTCVDVSLRVGPIAKAARVHGLRVWQPAALGGLAAGPARPLREPIPILYELAWGGLDLSDPQHPYGDPRNTVGRGAVRDWRSLIGQPAAQIERPDRPLGGHDNEPWGLGAIHRHWQPRASFAGTYDAAWMETKAPLLPDDFDPRFNVCVPHDQWAATPLRSDVPIEVTNATPAGVWRFQLPRVEPGFTSQPSSGREASHRTHLDTILVDADRGRVELTWRAAVPMPRKYEMLARVTVVAKHIV